MTRMKRRTALAVTIGVWVAALGSAAALTYALNRPLHWVGTTSQLGARSGTARAASAEPVSELQSVLYMPTITVVGQAPHHPSIAQ
jgi:hypothetical protein